MKRRKIYQIEGTGNFTNRKKEERNEGIKIERNKERKEGKEERLEGIKERRNDAKNERKKNNI